MESRNYQVSHLAGSSAMSLAQILASVNLGSQSPSPPDVFTIASELWGALLFHDTYTMQPEHSWVTIVDYTIELIVSC